MTILTNQSRDKRFASAKAIEECCQAFRFADRQSIEGIGVILKVEKRYDHSGFPLYGTVVPSGSSTSSSLSGGNISGSRGSHTGHTLGLLILRRALRIANCRISAAAWASTCAPTYK